MKRIKKDPSVGFWILFVLTALIVFAVLELNKNTVFGFFEAALILIVYLALRLSLLKGQKWPLRALGYFAALVLLVLTVAHTPGPYRARPAVDSNDPQVTGIVTVEQGKLTGLVSADGMVEVYAGIPYAKPPVGELRWREPQDPEPWQGVFAADSFAPMSMQPQNSQLYSSLAQLIGYHDYEISLKDNFRDLNSEDALYLNVWKPAGEQKDLPVIVYIHGGSLQTGQPWYADYSGLGLARKGAIVVNMGYRLGVFGFLAAEELAAESPNGTTGNYGLLDQIKALEWVRDNISAFGGDPDNVTLAGESAGSACVSALCVSPLARGLFRRAIGESSTVTAPQPAHSFRLLPDALSSGEKILERFGVSSVAELRQLPAETLVAAADTEHHMTIDGWVLTQTPYEAYRKGEHNEEAILHGYNALEGTPFILFNNASLKDYSEKLQRLFGEYAPEVELLYPSSSDQEAKDQFIQAYSAYFFTYGHACWSRLAAANGEDVYAYYFSKDNGRLGAWHSGEEVYCYGNIPNGSRLYTDEDRALSEIMCSCWYNFALTGNPNGEGIPTWEQTADGTRLFEFGSHVGMIDDPYAAVHEVMDRKYGFSLD